MANSGDIACREDPVAEQTGRAFVDRRLFNFISGVVWLEGPQYGDGGGWGGGGGIGITVGSGGSRGR